MSTHDEVRVLLGALVLGGLSDNDRVTVTQHLRTCADCRAELAELAPLPGLLSRVPAEARDDPARRAAEPADGQLAVLLAEVRRERATGRRRARVLVAAMIITVLGLGVVAVAPRTATTPNAPTLAAPSVTASPSVTAAPSVTASPSVTAVPPVSPTPLPAAAVLVSAPGSTTSGDAALTAKAWGTSVQAKLSGLAGPGPFVMVVVGATGRTEQAATWSATPTKAADVTGATSMTPAAIAVVQIRDSEGRVLASTV